MWLFAVFANQLGIMSRMVNFQHILHNIHTKTDHILHYNESQKLSLADRLSEGCLLIWNNRKLPAQIHKDSLINISIYLQIQSWILIIWIFLIEIFPTVYDLVYYYALMDRTTHIHTLIQSLTRTQRTCTASQCCSTAAASRLCAMLHLTLSLGLLSLAFMLPPGCRSNWWHWLREERGLQQRTTLASTHTHAQNTNICKRTNKQTLAVMGLTLMPLLAHLQKYILYEYFLKCIMWSSISNWLIQWCNLWRDITCIDYRWCICYGLIITFKQWIQI